MEGIKIEVLKIPLIWLRHHFLKTKSISYTISHATLGILFFHTKLVLFFPENFYETNSYSYMSEFLECTYYQKYITNWVVFFLKQIRG